MIAGLERVQSHRVWFVPDVMVWGVTGVAALTYLVCERVGSDTAVYFDETDVGDSVQTVTFGELTDHRGNKLPAAIKSPRVIVRGRESTPVFIVGNETGTSFRIARDNAATGPVVVDLLIIEMGD